MNAEKWMSSKAELARPPPSHSPLSFPFFYLLFVVFQAQCQQRRRGTGSAWTAEVPWCARDWGIERCQGEWLCPGCLPHHRDPPTPPWPAALGRAALQGSLGRQVRVTDLSSGHSVSTDTDLNTFLTQKLGSYTREVKWSPVKNLKFYRGFWWLSRCNSYERYNRSKYSGTELMHAS